MMYTISSFDSFDGSSRFQDVSLFEMFTSTTDIQWSHENRVSLVVVVSLVVLLITIKQLFNAVQYSVLFYCIYNV